MSKLYLLCHGETLFDVLGRKEGWCDSPLTAAGVEQARRAAVWLIERDLEFDHVYASCSERACDTVELAVPGMPYKRDKGLKDRCFGSFEGLTRDLDLPAMPDDFYVPFGGESIAAFRARVTGSIRSIMERPCHECVLAVTHKRVCEQILLDSGDEAAAFAFPVDEGRIVEIGYESRTGFTPLEVFDPSAGVFD